MERCGVKILMICNTDGALYIFRQPLIKRLVKDGHSVASITSDGGYIERLRALGVDTRVLHFANQSLSIIDNMRILFKLRKLIRKERPDIVHGFTHKPAIYGTIAARLSGTGNAFVTITGLGALFTYDDLKTRAARFLLLLQYRIALRYAKKVFFQNPDDMGYFLRHGIVDEKKAILTNGSGIDLVEYSLPSEEETQRNRAMLGRELGVELTDRKVVLFLARAFKEKGFFEFYEAARAVNASSDGHVFVHLGLVDEHLRNGITRDSLSRLAAECGVHYLGFKDNIRDYMAASDIVALPSYYREGTPRSLIEALALGKFIITTDTPGCRETVIDGWNGFFCEPRDSGSLASRILAVDKEALMNGGGRSREHAERKYDASELARITFENYFGRN
jgi:N,N'-diacetylbacillosaminyl-diphospho-undecaprenol alpha-1,3-N-acetylgalactosaminyltransferase